MLVIPDVEGLSARHLFKTNNTTCCWVDALDHSGPWVAVWHAHSSYHEVTLSLADRWSYRDHHPDPPTIAANRHQTVFSAVSDFSVVFEPDTAESALDQLVQAMRLADDPALVQPFAQRLMAIRYFLKDTQDDWTHCPLYLDGSTVSQSCVPGNEEILGFLEAASEDLGPINCLDCTLPALGDEDGGPIGRAHWSRVRTAIPPFTSASHHEILRQLGPIGLAFSDRLRRDADFFG